MDAGSGRRRFIALEVIAFMRTSVVLLAAAMCGFSAGAGSCAERVELYGIHEVTFSGPRYGPADAPAVDAELVTLWRHESGRPTCRIYGFWDGDGKGANSGNVFKARFCPTKPGDWTLVRTQSNKSALRGQSEGYKVVCTGGSHKGFWLADGRWYKRSDGSHPYIIGNTMYSFLSEYDDRGPSGGNIADDIRANSKYFKKVRFSITPDRYPHPKDKPFLDDSGRPTDDGDFSHRPNPTWFHNRVDLAVRTAYEHDLIADLIINGPDTRQSRSVLRAAANGGDCTPILRYIVARYGSFPNVWICLANEFDIKNPKYTTAEIRKFGAIVREHLAYPVPMSVHSRPQDWRAELNAEPPWHDHVTLQNKLKKLHLAADFVSRNFSIGANLPVIDDELAYEGKGDGWSEADVIESHLGAFLGGGYGTTGHKPASKKGHYFFGNFKAAEHKAADNLLWLRHIIDENIAFWKMQPLPAPRENAKAGIFENLDAEFRAMAWPARQYVLGANKPRKGIRATLPDGDWRVTCYDVMARRQIVVERSAQGTLVFDSPDSRAALFLFSKTESPPAR